MSKAEDFFVLVAEMRHYYKLVDKNLKLDGDEEYLKKLINKRNELVKKVDDIILKVKNSKYERAASVQFLLETFPES